MKLELRGITKRFGTLAANDSIDLVVEPGEIHALLGENGAGKSTLMNVLYGLYSPDEGEILVDDEAVTFRGPGDAMAAGIGMVHQHFMLIPVFTVAENVMLGHEETRRIGFLDRRRARRDVEEISKRYRLDVPPDALVADLPVGVQQRVEIIKALSRDARILILDEPTAVLTPQETDDLIRVMRALRDGGTSIVFITPQAARGARGRRPDHGDPPRQGRRPGPADRLHDGAGVADGRAAGAAHRREGRRQARRRRSRRHGVTVLDEGGVVLVDDVSFQVRSGRDLRAGRRAGQRADRGHRGAGRADHPDVGRDHDRGRGRHHAVHGRVLDLGVGYVPEDRLHDGLVGDFSVAENLVLDLYDKPPFASGPAMNLAAIEHNADRAGGGVRRPHLLDVGRGGTLSGGNQQKVVLARELSRPLKLLIVAQPTRGLDVGSMEFVHRRIVAERDRGAAVVLISTELDEVLGLADRIGVMYRGRIEGEVGGDASAEEIGLLMAGSHDHGEEARQ